MHATPDAAAPVSEDDWSWERQQDRYTIVDAINRAAAATKDEGRFVGSYEMQLALVLDQYSGRRTVVGRMVQDVAELAVGRVAEVEALHGTYVAGLTAAHEAQVADLRDQLGAERRAVSALQAELRGARVVSEDRRRFGDDKVACTFTNGSSVAIWSPAQLEEVAYRVRAAGGSDDESIHVRVRQEANSALKPVEFACYLPDLSMLSFDLSTPARPGARKDVVAPTTAAVSSWAQWWPPSRSPVVTGVVAVLTLILGIVVGWVVL